MKKIIAFFQNINWKSVFNAYHNRILGLRADFVVDPKYRPITITISLLAIFGIMYIAGKFVEMTWFADTFFGNVFAYFLATLTWIAICQFLPKFWQAISWLYNRCPNVKKLLIMAARVNIGVLENLPNEARRTETVKYIAVGLAVMVAPLLGFVTASNIGCDIFHMEYPWMLGLFWSSIILIIEMALIGSMKREPNGKYSMKTLAMRACLALLLGIIVALPIEIKVFDAEIKEQLAFEKIEAVKEMDIEMKDEKKEVDEKIAVEESKVTAYYNEYMREVNESIGGRPAGKGKEADAKMATWGEQDSIFKHETRPKLLEEKTEIEKKFASRKALWAETQAKGLGGRLEALHRTEERKPVVFWAHLFLTLFFITLEMIAVLVKFMMKKGPYEEVVEAIEIAAADAAQKARDAQLVQQNTVLQQVRLVESGKLQVAGIEQQTVVAIATETAAQNMETARLEATHRAQTQRAINQERNRLDGTTIASVAAAMHTSAQIQRIAGELAQVIAQITSLTAEQVPHLQKGLEKHRDKLRLELEALTA